MAYILSCAFSWRALSHIYLAPMNPQEISKLFDAFIERYNREEKDAIWQSQSQRFRDFWNQRIMAGGKEELSEAETDEIIRILDRNGKGNTAMSEAVARVMIPQGAWRRMFTT
jgi:hypothetical protein